MASSSPSARIRRAVTVTVPAVVLVAAMILGLLSVDWLLPRRNDSLTRQANAKERALIPARGALLPALEGVALDGTWLRIDYGGDQRPTVLFVFSTSRSICASNWPYWHPAAGHPAVSMFRTDCPTVADRVAAEDADGNGLEDRRIAVATVDPEVLGAEPTESPEGAQSEGPQQIPVSAV